MAGGISKAFLLAAGLGTRLRPLTDRTPKCLVPIQGQHLLSIWLDFCEQQGIREALINTHHLAGQVREWAANQNSTVKISLFHEDSLLGSAGTIAANRAFIGEASDFYVFYADNLVRTDLARLKALHRQHSGVLSMGLFQTPKPQDCGVVTLDVTGRITSFEEKPANPRSNLAYAGLIIARASLFDYLPRDHVADLGKDVLPKLVGAMWGAPLEGYLLDIGTPENYAKALKDWPSINLAGRRDSAAGS